MRKLVLIIAGLCALQLLRIGLVQLVFLLITRTLVSDVIFDIAFMTVLSGGIILAARIKNFKLAVWPAKFSEFYIITTLITAAIFISTPFITSSFNLYGILSLLYGAAITPIYEELIFRGFIWQIIHIKSEKSAYIVSTLLFAVWHLGYIDTVIWRTSLFFPDANIPEIMFWKVITGLIIGALLGAARYKLKNVYSSMLLHCVINTVGG